MTNKNKDKGKGKEDKTKPPPPAVVEAREQRAYFLYIVKGLNFREVTVVLNQEFPAYPLKSDHQAVQKMIERVKEDIKKENKKIIEEIREESSARLDYATRKAVEAVEALENNGIEKIVKKIIDKPIEQTLKERVVDSKLLNIISDNAIKKATLYGAIAAKKLEHAGPGGGPIPVQPFDMEEWKRIRQERIDKVKKLEK